MFQPILFKSKEIVPFLKLGMPFAQIASFLNVSADLFKAWQSLYFKDLVNFANATMYKSIVHLMLKTNLQVHNFQRCVPYNCPCSIGVD